MESAKNTVRQSYLKFAIPTSFVLLCILLIVSLLGIILLLYILTSNGCFQPFHNSTCPDTASCKAHAHNYHKLVSILKPIKQWLSSSIPEKINLIAGVLVTFNWLRISKLSSTMLLNDYLLKKTIKWHKLKMRWAWGSFI